MAALMWRTVVVALVVPAAAMAMRAAGAETRPATEYEIKAAFLHHFTRYVEWPPAERPGAGEAFVVTVLGEDPFGEVLEAISREQARDRPWAVRRVSRVEDVGHSQILFISKSEADDLPRILQRLQAAPILTVGESAHFTERGGMIRFRRDGERIAFDINISSAERAGLRISSQLLKLARIVGPGRG